MKKVQNFHTSSPDKGTGGFLNSRLKQRGFSLVGTLSASVVGLIVVAGMSQMFVNMAGQIRDVEKRTAAAQFYSDIGSAISKPGVCVNTLQDYGKWIHKGHPKNWNFSKILDKKANNIQALDLSNSNNQQIHKQSYGMDGHVSYQMKCLGRNNDENCDCRSSKWNYSSGPCRRQWEFSLIFQSRKNGVLVYQRPFSYNILIEYPEAPKTAKNGAGQDRLQANFSCNSQMSPFVAEDGNPSRPHSGPGGNVFAGHEAGWSNQTGLTKGEGNVFVGYRAGRKNTTGSDNTYIGALSGHQNTTGKFNTFIGEHTFAQNERGEYNTVLGAGAGGGMTGSDNVVIGAQATNSSNLAVNGVFLVGNRYHKDWITGSFGSNSLFINGKRVCTEGFNCGISALPNPETPPSSKTLKKNIRPFSSIEKSLEDILKTPLFTYQYKDKNFHPAKKRMGLIAEDLPKDLQLPVEDRVEPDWPSVYGTLWAGIKALHSKIEKEVARLLSSLKEFKEDLKKLEKQISSILKKQAEKDKKFLQMEKELKENRKQIQDLKKELQKIRKLSPQKPSQ